MFDHQRAIASTRADRCRARAARRGKCALGLVRGVGDARVGAPRSAGRGREPLVWGLLGIVVAAIVGIVVGVRRRPPVDVVRAMLDAHWQCGGLLMASGDADARAWPIAVPVLAEPIVRWRGGRQCGIMACSAGFALLSFLMPARFFDELGSQRLAVGAEVEKLVEKVELLKEEKILPPERVKSLELTLEQLQSEASGSDPSKTWEALDHLDQSIAKAAAEAAEDAARDAQRAARAQELATALDQGQDKIASAELTEAMNVLAKDVKQAADDDELLSEELSGDGSAEIWPNSAKTVRSTRSSSAIGQSTREMQEPRSREIGQTGRRPHDRSRTARGVPGPL